MLMLTKHGDSNLICMFCCLCLLSSFGLDKCLHPLGLSNLLTLTLLIFMQSVFQEFGCFLPALSILK